MLASVRSRLAAFVEDGGVAEARAFGRVARAAARLWAPVAARGIVRPLIAPADVQLVAVGGATLGGSGRTRLALAVTRELAAARVPVALVGHAYRARPQHARVVGLDDALAAVGDEALACARELAGTADVVVAPSRTEAVALAAARGARVVVLDGPLQTAPSRSALSLLAVDRDAPWGAGHVLPAGDLRAPVDALVRAADLVVEVHATPGHARLDGEVLPLPDVARRGGGGGPRGGAVGLFTALARPERLRHALARAGVAVAAHVRAPDHGPCDAALLRRLHEAEDEGNVSIWLASPKCAEHLRGLPGPRGPSGQGTRRRVATLIDAFALPEACLDPLRRVALVFETSASCAKTLSNSRRAERS